MAYTSINDLTDRYQNDTGSAVLVETVPSTAALVGKIDKTSMLVAETSTGSAISIQVNSVSQGTIPSANIYGTTVEWTAGVTNAAGAGFKLGGSNPEAPLKQNGKAVAQGDVVFGGRYRSTYVSPGHWELSGVGNRTFHLEGGGGTGNAQTYSVIRGGGPAALVPGMRFTGQAAGNNTGPTTFTIPGFGSPFDVKDQGGAALQGGEIVSGDMMDVVYNGAHLRMNTDHGSVRRLEKSKTRELTIGGSSTPSGWVMTSTNAPTLTAPTSDGLFSVSFNAVPTSGAVITVDGHGPYPIKDRKGSPLVTNDIPINEEFLAHVEGGSFKIYTRFVSAAPVPTVAQVTDLLTARVRDTTVDGASTPAAWIFTTSGGSASLGNQTEALFHVTFNAVPTTGATAKVDDGSVLPIRDSDGTGLVTGNVPVGRSYLARVKAGGFNLYTVFAPAAEPVTLSVSSTMPERRLTSPLPIPSSLSRLGFLEAGQSIRSGYHSEAGRLLTTTAIYAGLTFAAGPRSYGTGLDSEIGMIETVNYFYTGGGNTTFNGETSASGFVQGFTEYAAKYFGYVHEDGPKLFGSCVARNGTPSTGLVPTTHPNYVPLASEPVAPFDVLKDHITAAKARADDATEGYALYCINADQGQGDEYGGYPAADWLTNWLAIYDGATAHAKSVSGQTFDPLMMFSQVYAGTRDADGESIASAQVALEAARPGRCFMLTPLHQLAIKAGYGGVMFRSDGHLTHIGNFYLGVLHGRACAQAIFKGTEPARMRETGATYDGTAVTLHLHAPRLPVVIDNSEGPIGAGRVKDAGLAIEDDTGIATLTSVEVGADGKSLVLTPDRALTGTIRIRGGRDYLAPAPGTEIWTDAPSALQVDYEQSAVLALRESTPDVTLIEGAYYSTAYWCRSFDIRVSDLSL